MTNTVSSERSVDTAVEKLAQELLRIRAKGGKTVVVCGPVVVHTVEPMPWRPCKARIRAGVSRW